LNAWRRGKVWEGNHGDEGTFGKRKKKIPSFHLSSITIRERKRGYRLQRKIAQKKKEGGIVCRERRGAFYTYGGNL